MGLHGRRAAYLARDVEPVLGQYANLYPVMRDFLDLGDYESVCARANLLAHAFSLDIGNPNSMPVTRDLSGAKRAAILRWLTEPGDDGKPLLGTRPGLATAGPAPVRGDRAAGNGREPSAARRQGGRREPRPGGATGGRRPAVIFVHPKVSALLAHGDVHGLRDALQAAIELEHAVIPPYLYALYSLTCPVATRRRPVLGSVVVEEMPHLTLAANILSGVGGRPALDRRTCFPVTPARCRGRWTTG